MGHLKWYKRDPRAALVGMRGLTLEECGAYNKILDLIYCHDGALEDFPREICRELGCNIRTWRRLKTRLLELGKLYVHAGCLRNERADEEIANAESFRKVSQFSARKRWATYNEIKRLQNADPMQTTTTYKKVSAKVVPILKRETKESGEK